MQGFDKFETQLPSFTLQGKRTIQSSLGAFCSMMVAVVVLLYASIKFIHLKDRHNPGIASYLIERPSNLENPLNLNAMNARIAFAFLGYSDQQLKDDPRFVKWIVRVVGKKDGERYERIVPYRSCTEDDIAGFYPITSA